MKSFEADITFANMQQLDTLDMDDNCISWIPPAMGSLPKLQTLMLRRNRISALPAELFNAPRLSRLRLEGNDESLTKSTIMQMSGIDAFIKRRKERLDKEIAGGVMGVDTSFLGLVS